jgi:hypothetical protein
MVTPATLARRWRWSGVASRRGGAGVRMLRFVPRWLMRKKGLGRARKSVGLAVRNHSCRIGDFGESSMVFLLGSPIPVASPVPRRPMGSPRPTTTERGAHPTALDTARSTHTHTSRCASFLLPARVFSLDAPNAARRARARGSLKVRAPSVAAIARVGVSPARPRGPRSRLHASPRASTRPSRATSRPTLTRPRPRPVPRPFPPTPPRHPRFIHPHPAFPFSIHVSSSARSPSPCRAMRFDPIPR